MDTHVRAGPADTSRRDGIGSRPLRPGAEPRNVRELQPPRPARTCGGLIRISPQRRGEDGPRPGPSLEAVTADLLYTPGLRAPRRPATLKQAARGLKTANAGIGLHQTQALAHAIVAGWYLHYARRQVRHGEFGPWLEEHFDGSRQSAEAYRLIGRSYCQDPGNFTGTRSIEEAIKIARSLPK